MSNSLDVPPFRQRRPLRISTDVALSSKSSSDSSSSSSCSINIRITPPVTTNGDIPQYFLHVLCMHNFESSDPVHLSFHKDEVLIIVKQEHSGWWAAMRPQGDRIGWIPSSFVTPLDRAKITEYPDETQWSYGLNDPPVSAVHGAWVRVSEDHKVPSLQLVTPTDLVLCKGFFDDRVQNHGYESVLNLSNTERSGMGDICVPATPENPPPHKTEISLFLSSPLSSEPGLSQLSRPASPQLLDAAFASHHSDLFGADDQTLFIRLTAPASPRESVTSSDVEESLVNFEPVASSPDNASSDDGFDSQPQHTAMTATFFPSRPYRGISDIKFLHAPCGPDELAERFCVLMHAQYASIRQNDCLDWMKGRRSTGMTGLRRFFDTHDQIASWVQQCILACDDVTQQAEALDVWIRVAERCQTLRNFDSLCAIVLALSGSSLSSLSPAWERCSHVQTFTTLRNMLDIANKFRRIIDIMDAAQGPSIPFMRKYLEHIKECCTERSVNTSCQSGYTADTASSTTLRRIQLVAVSAMLRHQSSPYNFKTAESINGFIDEELRAVQLTRQLAAASAGGLQRSKLR